MIDQACDFGTRRRFTIRQSPFTSKTPPTREALRVNPETVEAPVEGTASTTLLNLDCKSSCHLKSTIMANNSDSRSSRRPAELLDATEQIVSIGNVMEYADRRGFKFYPSDQASRERILQAKTLLLTEDDQRVQISIQECQGVLPCDPPELHFHLRTR